MLKLLNYLASFYWEEQLSVQESEEGLLDKSSKGSIKLLLQSKERLSHQTTKFVFT